jgi:diaminohydroxyphosphoribosylaminopyrimidine deaminase/5-amino-6-(5-phosphoribosylamino)uracil reductase
LVDRILIYRAPIIVGEGKSSFGYIGLEAIADAHGRWRAGDTAALGIDRLEVYERVRTEA